MRKRKEAGFTLIEVVVVVAVIAILAAVLTPYITKYIDDSKIAKARNETQVIGGALTNFYKDVGLWPNRNPATGAVTTVLYTGTAIPTSYANFVNAGSGTGWAGASGNLDNNLLVNGNSGALYPTTTDLRWKGPYASSALPLDPWGRPYLVNVAATGPIWVISAGPNQRINTNTTDNTVPATADDIGFRVR
ncbi:MAG: type II secretion system major pseudopilin GspG [Deltaproteobacteria bacterium]